MNTSAINMNITGEYKDIIRRNGVIVDIISGHNIIVNTALDLIAGLIGNQITTNDLYWAVGSGEDGWDDTPVTPKESETTLTHEIGRKLLKTSNIEFYDEVNKHSDTPTNRLHIFTMFEENECNGTWREFGIFGNAAVTIDSGIMIDKKHHGVITKDTNTVIERHLILTFKLNNQTESEVSGS